MKRSSLFALTMALALPLGAAAQTTVVYQDMGAEREAFNKEAIRLFEEANSDIKIQYSWIANEPYKTGIKVMLESNSPPDLYFVWAGSFSNDFVDAGLANDISDSFDRGDAWTVGAPAGVVDQFRHKGGLYGVPGEVYTKYMWKNDAFFAENNLEVPASMSPIAFGASESWTINHYLTILFQRHVALDVALADYQLTTPADQLWTDPGYLAALKDFKRMETEGCFNDGINSVDPGVSRTMFATGLAAMTFCGSWCPPQFDEQGFEGQYSAFAFPAVAGGKGNQEGHEDGDLRPEDVKKIATELVGAQGYQVSASTKVRDETLKFLSWLQSPEMNALKAQLSGQLPANASALKEGDLPAVSIDLLARVAAAPVSVPPLNTIVETSVSDVILKSGQDLVAGTVTPEEFMERVRTQALEAQARK